MPIKVSIVEDEAELRESLAILINGAPGFQCVSTFASGEEALKGMFAERPDVVLMDINLPHMNGIECVAKLKAADPALQVMILTMYEDSDQIFKSLMAGASGYLLKRTPPARLLEAIEEVSRGGSPMSRQIARKVVSYFQDMKSPAPELQNLTKREQQILEFLAKGYLYKEIAAALEISVDTVRGHLRNIYDKLHVHSRTEAVVKFLSR
jgi:DNA-binding NarL/FixJ family response regulator